MNKTIEYYNKNANIFSSDTLNCKFNIIQDKFLQYIQPNSKILDLGCGAGRDSKYFKDKGYDVVALDGSSELCKITATYLQQEVICKDFKDIEYKNEFDGIWACASLLHLPSKDLPKVLIKCSKALKEKGIFYLSFKLGDYEGMRNGRYFTDFTEDAFKRLLQDLNIFDIKELFLSSDVRPQREQERWLNAFLMKKYIK